MLITSTGEGTIGRVDVYPYNEPAIADGHIAIVRLRPGINLKYVVEFLRSEYGQIQMLRFVSGSTGQTELLIEHVRGLAIPMPDPHVQRQIVDEMEQARSQGRDLSEKAEVLRGESATVIAVARRDMVKRLTESGSAGL